MSSYSRGNATRAQQGDLYQILAFIFEILGLFTVISKRNQLTCPYTITPTNVKNTKTKDT